MKDIGEALEVSRIQERMLGSLLRIHERGRVVVKDTGEKDMEVVRDTSKEDREVVKDTGEEARAVKVTCEVTEVVKGTGVTLSQLLCFLCVFLLLCYSCSLMAFLDAQASQDEMVVTFSLTDIPKPNLSDIKDTDLPDLPSNNNNS